MRNRIIIFIIAFVVVTLTIFGLYFYTKSNYSKEAEIIVKTNGGVPFEWEYEIEDPTVVELIKRESIEIDKNMAGGRVDIKYVFRGLKEGTTTIILRYVHVSRDAISKEEKYKVKVDENMNITIY